jgi:hypothetical protein
VTALDVISRLAWLALIVWGAWRIGISLFALPWRLRRHPQGFGGYLRDAFLSNLPFIMAFTLVWASVSIVEALELGGNIAAADIVIGVAVIGLGLQLPAMRRARSRVVAASGAHA